MKVSIDRILDYANEHYEDGWDLIVECYSQEDLLNEVSKHNFKNHGAAMKYFTWLVKLKKQQEEEIRSTEW